MVMVMMMMLLMIMRMKMRIGCSRLLLSYLFSFSSRINTLMAQSVRRNRGK